MASLVLEPVGALSEEQLARVRVIYEDARPVRTVFEVEDPDDAADDDAERLIRPRRVGFWAACGAQPLPAPGYVLPDVKSAGVTEPMLLMAATPEQAPPVR